MESSPKIIDAFWRTVIEYYDRHGRQTLAWRQPDQDGRFDPYRIVVSELMLQQTQVPRVIPKFDQFLTRFPSVTVLAEAPLSDVLIAWQGLGYNRRAKYLWQAAQTVSRELHGSWPTSVEGLVALPGIGKNTAGAVLAYAYNQPAIFIETNIRTVLFHHFYQDRTDIADSELVPLLAQLLAGAEPRTSYWALMDYGTALKRQGFGKIAQSRHYTKQSKFEGSRRQLRGAVLRRLSHGPATDQILRNELTDDRFSEVLTALLGEGMIRREGDTYHLA